MKLEKKFPSTIQSLPKNYIYINCPKSSYADVFFWVEVNAGFKLIGLQCKNGKQKMMESKIMKEYNKTQKNVPCDHLLYVLMNHYNSTNDKGFADSEIVPSNLSNNCTVLDERGVLPHFWWIATF